MDYSRCNYGTMPDELVYKIRRMGQDVYVVRVAVEPLDERDWWLELELPQAVWDYGAIVNAIITAQYPNDKMQAVVNNYLLDPTDSDALAEFNAMQQDRKTAKQSATELLEYAAKML